MKASIKNRYFGDKAFYKMVFGVAIPIMVQNGISNVVGLLDNIMVGQLGTEQMSGVAIVNQLIFIFFLCIFGGLSGAGIFTAQYFGNKDDEGIRHTFRYKFWLGLIIVLIAGAIFLIYGSDLISLYLEGSEDSGDKTLALSYGMEYLMIILTSLPAIFVGQLYASTLRECGMTRIPMLAGVVAVFVNLGLNYLLIFGHFGFPELGVAGAAIATVISRYVEMLIVMIWCIRHRNKHTFFRGIFSTLKVPGYLVMRFFRTGMPILVNEGLWSVGVAMLTQAYSIRGMDVLAGQSIASSINNIFNVAFIAMGDAVAILVGQALGSGELEKAREWARKLIVTGVLCGIVMGTLMFFTSGLIPRFYNTTEQAKYIATMFMMVQSVSMIKDSFLHCSYFTLRSGGKTIITFLFDSVFMLAISVPVAYLLVNTTDLSVVWIFALVHAADLLKCLIGYILLKKGVWVKNIVK